MTKIDGFSRMVATIQSLPPAAGLRVAERLLAELSAEAAALTAQIDALEAQQVDVQKQLEEEGGPA